MIFNRDADTMATFEHINLANVSVKAIGTQSSYEPDINCDI